MAPFEIRATENSLPTIIDTSTGLSILELDTREVDGVTYHTPVFASLDIAEKVLEVLGIKGKPESGYPAWHKALYYASSQDLAVAVVADTLWQAAAIYDELLPLIPEGIGFDLRQTLGQQRINFPRGGSIRFLSLRSPGRGISLDKVYLPRDSTDETHLAFLANLAASSDGEIIEY